MSDSTLTLNAGSGGASLATYTDSASDVHQKVILETQSGAADPTKVNASNPLPVSGTFWQATQPVSLAALPALAAGSNVIGGVTQSGSWTVSVSGTTTVAGTVTANLGTLNGVALDTSVNGILLAQGSTTSGQKGPLLQGAVTSAAPAYTSGQTSPLSLDAAGNLRVNVAAGGGSGGTSSTFGSAFPGTGTAVGATDGTNMRALNVDGSGNLKVNIVTGGGSGGTSLADGTTFTRGTTAETPIGGVVESGAPTLTAGKAAALSIDTAGNVRVNVAAGGITSGTAGVPSANVVTVQGVTGMTAVATTPALSTSGGASYNNAIAPATPAVTTVKSSAGNLYGCVCFNNTANPVYLKFFDAASVTLGTTAASFQFMIPGNTGGAGFVIPLPIPRSFANAIKYAVTGGISTTDNTAISANAVIVDVAFN